MFPTFGEVTDFQGFPVRLRIRASAGRRPIGRVAEKFANQAADGPLAGRGIEYAAISFFDGHAVGINSCFQAINTDLPNAKRPADDCIGFDPGFRD